MGEAMEETASLRTQLQAARAQTADAEERLVQALSSAAMQASGGHPTASSDHFSSIVTQQLQNQVIRHAGSLAEMMCSASVWAWLSLMSLHAG